MSFWKIPFCYLSLIHRTLTRKRNMPLRYPYQWLKFLSGLDLDVHKVCQCPMKDAFICTDANRSPKVPSRRNDWRTRRKQDLQMPCRGMCDWGQHSGEHTCSYLVLLLKDPRNALKFLKYLRGIMWLNSPPVLHGFHFLNATRDGDNYMMLHTLHIPKILLVHVSEKSHQQQNSQSICKNPTLCYSLIEINLIILGGIHSA